MKHFELFTSTVALPLRWLNSLATPYRHFMPSIEILGNDLRTLREREQFFVSPTAGRKPKDRMGQVESLIIKLRKQYLSVPEIKTYLNALEYLRVPST